MCNCLVQLHSSVQPDMLQSGLVYLVKKAQLNTLNISCLVPNGRIALAFSSQRRRYFPWQLMGKHMTDNVAGSVGCVVKVLAFLFVAFKVLIVLMFNSAFLNNHYVGVLSCLLFFLTKKKKHTICEVEL